MTTAVDVRLERVELPTYVPGPESVYPGLDLVGRELYPYTIMTDLSTQAVPVVHRVVVIENEYVRAQVLPDMGGRVFSLLDKTAGHDAFMTHNSIKFSNVSSRGAWIAGGIEFNYGQRGHTVNSVAPISWKIVRRPDGSAGVWVGATIRPVGSRWSAWVGLRPGRKALEVRVQSMGPPMISGLMYWWSNAGVLVGPQSRFYYYGTYGDNLHARHGWPIVDGIDYSRYRNRLIGSDMFLMEPRKDYMAFYDFGRQHGVINNADRHELPGQKYFTWGTHQEGRYWDDTLSDRGETYCEIQRGRLPTQLITEPIAPMSQDAWSEEWIPFGGTDGFSALESDIVLSVAGGAGKAQVHLLPLREVGPVKVEARAGQTVIGQWDVPALSPEKPWAESADLPDGAAACDAVRVTDAHGRVLVDWKEFSYRDDDFFSARHEPFHPQGQPAERLVAQSQRLRFLNWPRANPEADELLAKALAIDPDNAVGLRVLAERAMFAGHFQQAAEHLRRAIQRLPFGCDANRLLLGWALLARDKDTEAAEEFAQAARHEATRRDARVGLCSVHFRAGAFDAALTQARLILAERPGDAWGGLMEATALRRLGRKDEAGLRLRTLLEADPLWPRLSAEAALLGLDAGLAEEGPQPPCIAVGAPRRLADDSVTAALPYIELKLWDDAEAILSIQESDEPTSPADRLAHLVYVQYRRGGRPAAQAAADRLAAATPELAHPWSTTSLGVLIHLTDWFNELPIVHVMLGNLLASRHRHDEAGAQWEKAAYLNLPGPVAHRNLAALAANREKFDAALEHYEQAWRRSGRDLNLFTEFDRFLASRGMHGRRLEMFEELEPALQSRSAASLRRVIQLLDAGRFADALREFRSRTFLRGEFERGIRYNYLEAVVGAALPRIEAGQFDQARATLRLGLEYPRNINMGRNGTRPNEAMIHYWLGLTAEMAGDLAEARAHWTDAATELHGEAAPQSAYEMLAWLALGRSERALLIAHVIEQVARGEREQNDPSFLMFYSPEVIRVCHGLAQLAKGRIDQARALWQQALSADPGVRLALLHLSIPPTLLARMARKATGPAACAE